MRINYALTLLHFSDKITVKRGSSANFAVNFYTATLGFDLVSGYVQTQTM
jgi:hypothetical protein